MKWKKKSGRVSGEEARQQVREFFSGRYWCFLAFTPERGEALKIMLAEAIAAAPGKVEFTHAHFPPGMLWNGEECHALFVVKDHLPRGVVVAGLHKHFGYECPDPASNIFTLGVTPEDDALLDRVGLFGRKEAT
jgi:hypothetical protein